MLVLFETSAGFAIFKVLNEGKLKNVDNLYEEFETPEKASQMVQLQHFLKFSDTTEGLAAVTGLIEGKMSKPLRRLLKRVDCSERLALADAKLGQMIREKTGLQCETSTAVGELLRCIRQQADNLMPELPRQDITAMQLGLAHSLSRYRLKFSPDKVDTMIVQAVCLLDDLDKELNNYVMRCREWYGWHFPELGKLITDNLTFVKLISKMGMRTNALDLDMSDLLPEDVEEKVKKAAEISMGTEISELDLINIRALCTQIEEITEYRASLHEYLKNRMMAVAPNLSILVGDIVGARLISHAGSLMSLAKHPASTVQILGAEKALFRALKTKHDTPKYGLIYHAQLVTQSSAKLKGKASRMLATKAALACRVDALGESNTDTELGIEHRAKLESRLKSLEEGAGYKISATSRHSAKFDSYSNTSVVKTYSDAADSVMPSSVKRRFEDGEEGFPKKVNTSEVDNLDGSYMGPSKKKRLHSGDDQSWSVQAALGDRVIKQEDEMTSAVGDAAVTAHSDTPKKKKKKAKHGDADGGDVKQEDEGMVSAAADTSLSAQPDSSKKKKKKKTKQTDMDQSGVKIEDEEMEPVAEFAPSTVQSDTPKKKKTKNVDGDAVGTEGAAAPDSGKKKKKNLDLDQSATADDETQVQSEKKKKKKKNKPDELEQSMTEEPSAVVGETSEKKKKKKSLGAQEQADPPHTEDVGEVSSEKKKKKKSKHQE